MRFLRKITRALPDYRRCINVLKCRHKMHCVDTWRCCLPSSSLHGGTLAVNTACNVSIEPLHLQSAADVNDQVLVSLHVWTKDEGHLSGSVIKILQRDIKCEKQFVADESRRSCKVDVQCSGKTSFIDIRPEDITLAVKVPYQFSVQVNSEQFADVHVKGLEGETYDVNIAGSGNCYLSSLKGQSINSTTASGNIVCDSYLLSKHGSLVAKKTGDISVNKIQGGEFSIETEQGHIDIQAVYLAKCNVTSQLGNIKLGDIHGISEVSTSQGDITVGSIQGSLGAATNAGNIDAFISEHENVELRSDEGNITVKMGSSIPSDLTIEAKKICVDPSVELHACKRQDLLEGRSCVSKLTAQVNADEHKEPKTVEAKARFGKVKLEKMDWFSSLKLDTADRK